ncbi:serine/threonine protein kinase [Hymenobacter luteus]|uniref:Serine/threonine protein kinase n=2 Tax=Hymenobacter TaxID=89966 RepID=A0A7W9T1D4_9BACT|nr:MULTISPECIES: serine/threonine-protein kinase [Hymenobacter]MBB4600915.1 serine/threonine protein kinase [Hymenobacter latericoloratus]MBB6058878.1 serine/threonine protein kinase [Hymenobacter luteus]
MPQIDITLHHSTGLVPEFEVLKFLDVDDKPLGEGGFGAVYRCRSVNGQPVRPAQVIKLFRDNGQGSAQKGLNTIERLQERLRLEHAQLQKEGKELLVEYPALAGAPQFSFQGIMQGQAVSGYAANNLHELGFLEFKDILEDEPAGTLERYQRISADQKLLLAYQLASAFGLLRRNLYVHADFKAGALFVNPDTLQCALIDYDSGAVLHHKDDRPTTFGEMQDWLAPEIIQQLAEPTNQTRTIQVDFASDTWSVGIGIFYLLHTVHPLYFLQEVSVRSLRTYLKQYTWPEVDPAFTYFDSAHADTYPLIRRYYETLPELIRDKFGALINRGFTEKHRRPSYEQWQSVLRAAQLPPEVEYFAVSPPVVVKGQSVTLTWAVQSATKVMVNRQEQAATGSLKLPVEWAQEFQLEASNAFGTSQASTQLVHVVAVPEIKLTVPSPNFTINVAPSAVLTRLPTIELGVPFDYDNLIDLHGEALPQLPDGAPVHRTLRLRLRSWIHSLIH